MQNYIRKRAVKIARYILQTSDTVRGTADVFGISKSTVHKDVSERLPRISKELADEVRSVLDRNKAERHLRGGEATRKKYAQNHDKHTLGQAEMAASCQKETS